MKATELRIGNFVYQGPKYLDCAVNAYQIYQFSLFEKNKGLADYYNQWKPTPITEEWLTQFKQITFVSDKTFICDIGYISLVGDGIDIILNGSTKSIHRKYVHELQNIFFELIRIELEFNEKAQEEETNSESRRGYNGLPTYGFKRRWNT